MRRRRLTPFPLPPELVPIYEQARRELEKFDAMLIAAKAEQDEYWNTVLAPMIVASERRFTELLESQLERTEGPT